MISNNLYTKNFVEWVWDNNFLLINLRPVILKQIFANSVTATPAKLYFIDVFEEISISKFT